MYNPEIHHRRTIRLQEYDYSSDGLYFVTICTQGHRSLFGTIKNGIMHLNEAGQMVQLWFSRCEEHFQDIKCLEMVVMPNHFHCIWQIVGADRCVCPQNKSKGIQGEHIGSPLHRVVQWFKTMTTNAYINGVKQHGWPSFNSRLWQRNYYEHIIRNQQGYEEIAAYIVENPTNWENDKLYNEK
ncbi:MAG: transposase [Bacteroidaceae bacterium]|nr:transposase [Bacteroidaceae bacterium]